MSTDQQQRTPKGQTRAKPLRRDISVSSSRCFRSAATISDRETGSVIVELTIALPLFFTIFFSFIIFGIGVSSIGIVSRDAYVFSLLSEAAQTPGFQPARLPLERFIVGHPSDNIRNSVVRGIRNDKPFNPDSDVHMGFLNYVAGEAVRRRDAVGFTESTNYMATSVQIEQSNEQGMSFEKRSVQRRIHLLGTHVTLHGAFFELL